MGIWNFGRHFQGAHRNWTISYEGGGLSKNQKKIADVVCGRSGKPKDGCSARLSSKQWMNEQKIEDFSIIFQKVAIQSYSIAHRGAPYTKKIPVIKNILFRILANQIYSSHDGFKTTISRCGKSAKTRCGSFVRPMAVFGFGSQHKTKRGHRKKSNLNFHNIHAIYDKLLN